MDVLQAVTRFPRSRAIHSGQIVTRPSFRRTPKKEGKRDVNRLRASTTMVDQSNVHSVLLTLSSLNLPLSSSSTTSR